MKKIEAKFKVNLLKNIRFHDFCTTQQKINLCYRRTYLLNKQKLKKKLQSKLYLLKMVKVFSNASRHPLASQFFRNFSKLSGTSLLINCAKTLSDLVKFCSNVIQFSMICFSHLSPYLLITKFKFFPILASHIAW